MIEDYFKVWSHKSCYILGFIVADGCLLYKGYSKTFKGNGYSLRIDLHEKDRNVLEFIADELESRTRPKHYVKKGNDGITRRQFNLAISSRKMLDSLIKLGITPNKTGKECFPKGMPNKYLWDFVRGYFDGDGSICLSQQRYKNKFYPTQNLKFTCANGDFLAELKSKTKISVGTILHRKKEHCFVWQLQGKKEISKIGHLMYDNNCFCFSRKFNKVKIIMDSQNV